MAGNYSELIFSTISLATSFKLQKISKRWFLKNGKEYKEIIYEQRYFKKGVYFIGDPLEVIDDYENKDKWQPERNDVLQLEDKLRISLYSKLL